MTNKRIAHFIQLVTRGDPGEIESARDVVTREDVAPLAEVYWTLETWDQKAALIELVQDYIDPRSREIMLDFLKAPPDKAGDDYFEAVKAIALCHLDRDFKAFTRYYGDRRLLAETAERYLREAETQS
jgi:hypothetical protein